MSGPDRVSLVALGDLGRRPRRVALVGNPNVGKSSLFNALTGRRQKVSNYPGTTVERHEGTFRVQGSEIEIVDLPGTYSLLPRSPDEAVVRDELLGRIAGRPRPDVLVLVLDATNLERNLFLASQAAELRIRTVVALNQSDLAAARGVRIDPAKLSDRLGVPVVPTCARTGQGTGALGDAIVGDARVPKDISGPVAPRALETANALAPRLGDLSGTTYSTPAGIARALLSEGDAADLCAELRRRDRGAAAAEVVAARDVLAGCGLDVATATAAARYAEIERIVADAVPAGGEPSPAQRRADAFFLHPVFGSVLFVALAFGVLAAIMIACEPLMGAVESAFAWLGEWLQAAGSPVLDGLPGDFLVNGLLAGLSGFLVFVPQIAVFFLILELLDDSGYLARAALLLDRVMGRFGLPGRAFLPMLSGFACAIPGILSARTIANARDRFVTMAVLPLMSCQARLPVYFLMIAAAFTDAPWWQRAVTITAMYGAGILVALLCSGVLRRTVLAGGRTPLLLELPPYRMPVLGVVLRNVGRRTWSFVSGAGPIILGLTIALWFLLTFPRDVPEAAATRARAAVVHESVAPDADPDDPGFAEAFPDVFAERERLLRRARALQREGSYLGIAGKAIEPALTPIGLDWKAGVGILASFAAREVFVPTLGVVYAAGDEEDEESEALRDAMRADVREGPDGSPGRRVWTPLSAVSLMVFYVIALQCMSTLAVLRRETGSWRWPVGLFLAYTALAYLASLLVFRVGIAMGF